MVKHFCLILSCLIVILSIKPLTAQATSLYITPSGSDANPGTQTQPFATLAKARDTVRTLNQNMTEDITVYLRDGMYYLTGPLQLDQRDSGSNNFQVIYTNFPGERPILSGGRVITGWIPQGNLWKANVGTTLSTRQLFVNGNRATRARSGGGLAGVNETATGYSTTDSTLQNWGNKHDIEIVSNVEWRQYRCLVDTIVGTNITIQQPCWNTAHSLWNQYLIGLPTYLENAFELLDTPGEWYYNRTTGFIYYYPKSGENMATAYIVAPVVETLIQGTGTADIPIQNLRFEGLTFAHTTWLQPSTSEGFVEILSNILRISSGAWVKAGAAVVFDYARNITFNRNVFANLGSAGVTLGIGTKFSTISGNHFTDLSSSAIFLGLHDNTYRNTTDVRYIPEGLVVDNNYIHDTGVEYSGASAIWAGYVRNARFSHNEVHTVPYTGISLGWAWSAPLSDPSILQDNQILNNLVYDHMRGPIVDGGGIYLQAPQPNTLIANNVVRNQLLKMGGIYLDAGAQYIEVKDNVAVDNLTYNMFTYLTQGNNIHDNWWKDPVAFWNDLGPNTIVNNHVITDISQAPANIVAAAGLDPSFQDIKSYVPIIPPPGVTGDLTGDGHVNLADLTAAIASLNIFTYNQVVANFGK